jgi:hypothetical protein
MEQSWLITPHQRRLINADRVFGTHIHPIRSSSHVSFARPRTRAAPKSARNGIETDMANLLRSPPQNHTHADLGIPNESGLQGFGINAPTVLFITFEFFDTEATPELASAC